MGSHRHFLHAHLRQPVGGHQLPHRRARSRKRRHQRAFKTVYIRTLLPAPSNLSYPHDDPGDLCCGYWDEDLVTIFWDAIAFAGIRAQIPHRPRVANGNLERLGGRS